MEWYKRKWPHGKKAGYHKNKERMNTFSHFEANLQGIISEGKNNTELPDRLPTFEEFINGCQSVDEAAIMDVKDLA